MGEGGGGIECGCLGHFRLSLRFQLDRNILRKGGKLYFCVDACVYVVGCSYICKVEGEVISTCYEGFYTVHGKNEYSPMRRSNQWACGHLVIFWQVMLGPL